MSFTKVDLPEPETPVTTVRTPKGKGGINVFEIVGARAQNANSVRLGYAALGQHFDSCSARDVRSRQRFGHFHDFLRRTVRDEFSAVTSGSRTEVYHVVSAADGLLVVFHHQHGISEIAQLFERLEQSGVVAVMQADRWFVEHIQNAA